MATAELLLLLLVATALFGLVARQLRVPDAIVLVVAGLGVGFVPGLPHPQLDPQLIFLLVLPPMLHAQAWFTSWREFWAWRRAIFLLAVGLVLFTTVVVGLVLHWLEPQLPLAICFAFGAIVSPPDAVAAAAIAQAFKLPKRLVTILEGESLVNDATGLVAYKFALAAAATGQFSLGAASGRFLLVAAGGVVLGLAFGWLFAQVLRRVRDDSITIALTLIAPYSCYIAAEHLGVSGVLTVVTAGIWLGTRGSEILTPNARLKGFGFWSTFIFLLNGAVFLLIGLQLPQIIAGAQKACVSRPFLAAGAIFAVTVVARFVWVFPGAWLPRLLFRSIREREPPPTWQGITIVSWAGMRGVVSLAIAMALPNELAPGVPLPGRDLLIFLTFAVILGTLVIQGLTLPLLIRVLGMSAGRGAYRNDAEHAEEEEREARVAAANAGLARAKLAATRGEFPEAAADVIAALYEDRLRDLDRGESSLVGGGKPRPRGESSRSLRLTALAAERFALYTRRRERRLAHELLIKLERELDLEESRLQ